MRFYAHVHIQKELADLKCRLIGCNLDNETFYAFSENARHLERCLNMYSPEMSLFDYNYSSTFLWNMKHMLFKI